MTAQLTYTVSNVKREAEDALQRSHTALDVQPGRHTAQRFADVAQALSRAGVAAAHAEVLNAALQRLVELCYQRDTDARLCNCDTNGKLLVPAPWGKSGYKKWGLRRREADVLRAVLMQRQTPQQGRPVPLFVWDADGRTWYCNMEDYKSHAEAQAYVSHYGVSSREYKQALERVQTLGRG